MSTSVEPVPHAPPSGPRPRSSAAAIVIAMLAVGAALWLAQGLILPVLLAMFFALVGNPIIRLLQRLWIPRFIGALIVLAGGLLLAGTLANQLFEPASEWGGRHRASSSNWPPSCAR